MENMTLEQEMASTYNLSCLPTGKLIEHLDASLLFGSSMFLIGRRGVGKTFITKERIKESGHKEIFLNLSTLERPDLAGYPDILGGFSNKKLSRDEKVHRFVQYLLPIFYKDLVEGDTICDILFDEADKVELDLQAPLLEIAQSKSINGLKLPNLNSCIFTGNLISEGSKRPSEPLLDRTEKYIVITDAKQWLKWAATVNIHPTVVSYIIDNPQDLAGNSENSLTHYADASSRSWTNYSDVIYKGEKYNISKDIINEKASGFIGHFLAQKFKLYFDFYKKLIPHINNIVEGNISTLQYKPLKGSEKIHFCMILCSKVSSYLDSLKNFNGDHSSLDEVVSNVGKFLQLIEPENAYYAMRAQLGMNRLGKFDLDEHPDWERLCSAGVEV